MQEGQEEIASVVKPLGQEGVSALQIASLLLGEERMMCNLSIGLLAD